MAEYHVGCGISCIFAGTLNKPDKTGLRIWKDRSDVTDEAISAVAQYMKRKCTSENNYEYSLAFDTNDGKILYLTAKIEDKNI